MNNLKDYYNNQAYEFNPNHSNNLKDFYNNCICEFN